MLVSRSVLVASTALLVAAAGNTVPRVHAGPVASSAPRESVDIPPLFEGMGPYTRKVTTRSPEAQRYFDQGLNWTYAFNHDEATRAFRYAAELDPSCAMAWWGVALVNGPHINNPVMDEEHSRIAWEALQRALALREGVSPVERALIEALRARYADPDAGDLPLSAEERAPLDRAYAEAMEEVHRRFPDDVDVVVLYAESLMDLRPWDLWDGATGEPRPETPRIVAALERALEMRPDHPGANHYYIHAVEASPHPEKANAAADRLRTLMPASGHMVHMPSHIDVRTGRWAQAAEQNRLASKAAEEYRKLSPKQGFYRVYMAHNDHFLAYACMMLGRREEALAAARAMLSKIPEDWMRENAAVIDGYCGIETEALIRFGLWDDILAMKPPPEYLPITTAIWRFGRATALAAKGEVEAAVEEQALFREAVEAVPEGAVLVINPAEKVLRIAEHTLAGEIAFRRGEIDEAVSELTKAVEIEDTLQYMEPPDWVQPVRHSLGAVLVAAGRYEEAEKVYRADLERWPENGWALYGLARCLEELGSPEAPKVKERFKKAWAHADTEIRATCLCVIKVD